MSKGRAALQPVPCVLTGRNKSVTVASRGEVVAGEILLIRPGIEHTVICSGGINVMYLDGLQWSGDGRLAERLQGRLANLAIDAIFQGCDAQAALRQVASATAIPRTGCRQSKLIPSHVEKTNATSQTQLEGPGLFAVKAAPARHFGVQAWSGMQTQPGNRSGEIVRTGAWKGLCEQPISPEVAPLSVTTSERARTAKASPT